MVASLASIHELRVEENSVYCGPAALDVVRVGMPATFAAFCAERTETYCRYAAVRLGSGAAGRQVGLAALGDLAMTWAEALCSASPAALAWSLLTARAASHPDGGRRGLYELLPSRHADVLLLRYRLGLPARRVADLLGVSSAELHGISHAAVRELGESQPVREPWPTREA